MKPILYIDGSRGYRRTWFTIGVQSFHVCDERNMQEAKFYERMLNIAFDELEAQTLEEVFDDLLAEELRQKDSINSFMINSDGSLYRRL